MLKFLLICIQILFFIKCWGEEALTEEAYYCPAEFEPIEIIWMAFSMDAAKQGLNYGEPQLEIIKALAPNRIKVLIQNEKELFHFYALTEERGVDISHCECLILPFQTIWLRDIAPTFLKNLDSTSMQAMIFDFNEWGYALKFIGEEDELSLDMDLGKRLAGWLNLPSKTVSLVSEGGNREVNGKGVLICVEAVERDRNPGLSKSEIEEGLKESLCIEKVIWLPYGLVEDDPTDFGLLPNEEGVPYFYTPFPPGGHVDEFCRFVDENTVLLAEIELSKERLHPIEIENAKRIEMAYDILKNASDLDGRALNIIRVPSAELMFDSFEEGDDFYEHFKSFQFIPTDAFPFGHFPEQESYPVVVSASYLNFLICNELLLLPKYWKEGRCERIKEKDREVEELFKAIFPNKTIRFIDVYNLGIAGGGIHCITHYQPR